MLPIGWVAPAIAALALGGCLFSGGSGKDDGGPYPGMRLIRAKDKSFLQGSEGPLAGPSESPAFRSGFRYDYWMDRTEVTQGEFAALMGWNPVGEASIHGRGEAFPVHGVTWYDAVLYCNARSRKAGLDTVYAYERADKGATGSAHHLAGLSIRLGAGGFRLPTEAEWEFAARAGSAGEFAWGDSMDAKEAARVAWYEGNAKNTSHPVGSLSANAYGLHDMAGNVLEWVHDWKGAYPGEETYDFAGARDPGPQGEKPVKGGAFAYGIRQLRPSARAATYATTPSAKAEYVGFRCAQAALSSPRFTDRDGGLLQTDPVSLPDGRLPRAFAGRRVKLAFVNASGSQRNLAFVDYGRFPPLVHEFPDVHDVHYPSVSPDGQWVAYGSAPEGAEQGSVLSIRKLDAQGGQPTALGPGFIPRWWVDETARDTFLVYASSAVSNLESRWSATTTRIQKIQAGKPAGEATTLIENGGYHDGRSRGGRWLATGYQLLRVRDLDSARSQVLFTGPGNGKGEGDTSQVCNVSMAPDSSGRVLFLDFGHPRRSDLTGMSYGIHQIAFLSDPAGKVLRWYLKPPKEESWDEMEWSNDARFAVSAARDGNDRHRNLYLLDLEDSAAVRLVSGTRIFQPSLWVDPKPALVIDGGLDPDSLGLYNDPPSTSMQIYFADKMKKFWKGRAEWEVLALGSSHTHFAVDPHGFTGLKAFNFGYMGNGWLGSRTLALDYGLNICPRLKAVVVEVFAQNLVSPEGDPAFRSTIGRTKGYNYDRGHGFWKEGLPPQLEGLVQAAPNPVVDYVDTAGWEAGVVGKGWGANPPPTQAYAAWPADHAEYRRTLEDIRAALRILSDRKIHVWLVNFPQSPGYRGGSHYQFIGPSWETGRAVMADFKALESISPYIHFYDAYADGEHDYAADEAMDWDHLNGKGAVKLTRRLDSLLRSVP